LYLSARTTAICAALSSAVLLVACSSSGSADKPTTSASVSSGPATSSGSGASATESSPSAPGQLAKADFVAQANAVCRATYPKIHPGPAPTGPTDYAALLAYAQATLREFPPFDSAIQALVARSADKDELTTKWVAVDEASVAAGKPFLQQLIAAVGTRDNGQIQQALNGLNAVPDQSQAEATFLTGYGLTECAKLASS
jgi:hypothetical protein